MRMSNIVLKGKDTRRIALMANIQFTLLFPDYLRRRSSLFAIFFKLISTYLVYTFLKGLIICSYLFLIRTRSPPVSLFIVFFKVSELLVKLALCSFLFNNNLIIINSLIYPSAGLGSSLRTRIRPRHLVQCGLGTCFLPERY